MRRGVVIAAMVVTVIELGATYASLGAEPLALAPGWSPTRGTDVVAFALTVVGCAALFAIRRSPTVATLAAVGAYIGFMLLGYEFGMTLPAMVAIFLLVAGGERRLTAVVGALGCLGVSLIWVARRTASVAPESALLVWVAFGTVCAVFFFLPILIGEIVRTRRALATANRALARLDGAGVSRPTAEDPRETPAH